MSEAPGNARILLIDDDASLTTVVAMALEAEGYAVHTAANGVEGLQSLFRWQPDVVLLDVMMPRMDGWETCSRIREISDVPILMLTGRGTERDELRGLRGGADVYVTKPFVISVLVAQVEALLRRTRRSEGSARRRIVSIGELSVDLTHKEVSVGGRAIDLTPTEFKLLAALAARPGEVVQHRDLLTQIWGPEYVDEDAYLKLYVCYLRQKIERDPSRPTYIITKRGIGYLLGDGSARSGGKRRQPATI